MTTNKRGPLRQRSSTFNLLKGTRYGSKRIAGVYRGPGAERVITFAGGGQKKVHRSDIYELAKMEGSLRYRTKYDLASRREKRQMLRKSRARNAAIKRGHIKRSMAELVHMAEPDRSLALAKLIRMEHAHNDSIHVGGTPASSLLTPRPQQAFKAAKDAGGRWVTMRQGGQSRRILVRN